MRGLSREDIDDRANFDEAAPLYDRRDLEERSLDVRLLSERGRQKWSTASMVSGALCLVLAIVLVYFLAPSASCSPPRVIDAGDLGGQQTEETRRPAMAPTNERIKLANKAAITYIFGSLGEKFIFFIVAPHTYDFFTDMAICAVESAARTNPDHKVLLLHIVDAGARPSEGVPKGSATAECRKGVFEMDNVFVADINITDAFQGTILEKFYNETLSKVSQYKGQHIANFGRFQLMYDYGGVYSDTDAIFFGNVSKWRNTIGYEGQTRRDPPAQGYQVVNNAVLMFEPKHPFMYEYVKRYRDEYDNRKKIWAVVVATVLGSECTDDPLKEICRDVTFAPPKAFYYVGWGGAPHYLIKRSDDERKFDKAVAKHRNTTIAHLWNSFKTRTLSFEQGVPADEDVLYGKLMKDQCPWVYGHQYDKSKS